MLAVVVWYMASHNIGIQCHEVHARMLKCLSSLQAVSYRAGCEFLLPGSSSLQTNAKGMNVIVIECCSYLVQGILWPWQRFGTQPASGYSLAGPATLSAQEYPYCLPALCAYDVNSLQQLSSIVESLRSLVVNDRLQRPLVVTLSTMNTWA